tara:strand:+ start:1355 stop:2122 length:768 start_codon:yes stop_codon:yes gene_type:complete
MNLGIKNKRVLVCGASQNIGESIVKDFSKEGCKVTMIARNEKKLKKIFNSLGGKKNGHSYFVANLLEKNVIPKVINDIIKKHKKIDIIVHNIGGSLGKTEPLSNIESWKDVWNFNVGIAIEINNILIPLMIKNKWGRIVHISSIVGQSGHLSKGSIAYAASKSYLNSYVKGIGRTYANKNIVISAVMPGAILAKGKYWERIKKNNPKILKNFLKEHQAIGRLGLTGEVSPFVVFLSSQQASFACGSIIPVDGGWF